MSMVRLLSLAMMGLAVVGPPVFAAEGGGLNVLLITSDDLGLQLSCYGNTVIETPALDRLAREGTRFEVAHVAQASCSPSRSAMFTGLFPHTNGQYGLTGAGFSMHEGMVERTIPAILKRAGYRTGIIGKLHVDPADEFPFDVRHRGGTRDVREAVGHAAAFLEESGERPFFLMITFTDPHAYRRSRESEWSFPDQWEGLPRDPVDADEVPPLPFQRIDTPEQLEKVAGYYNCVRRMDAGVGMLLDALEESGRRDDTLVIFVGDHGPPFNRGKTTCYEGGLRVPFLVRWPGVSEPMVSDAMVSTVDILPTALDAAGLEIPDGLHGRSLRPVVRDSGAPWREYLAAEFHFHGRSPFYPRRSIRDDRWHLIHNLRAGQARPITGIDGDQSHHIAQSERYAGTAVQRAFETFADPPEFELYDLQADPWEFHNLAGDPRVAEVEQRMKEALMDWRRRTDDPLLDPEMLKEMARR